MTAMKLHGIVPATIRIARRVCLATVLARAKHGPMVQNVLSVQTGPLSPIGQVRRKLRGQSARSGLTVRNVPPARISPIGRERRKLRGQSGLNVLSGRNVLISQRARISPIGQVLRKLRGQSARSGPSGPNAPISRGVRMSHGQTRLDRM
jgi:hypothetical protein